MAQALAEYMADLRNAVPPETLGQLGHIRAMVTAITGDTVRIEVGYSPITDEYTFCGHKVPKDVVEDYYA